MARSIGNSSARNTGLPRPLAASSTAKPSVRSCPLPASPRSDASSSMSSRVLTSCSLVALAAADLEVVTLPSVVMTRMWGAPRVRCCCAFPRRSRARRRRAGAPTRPPRTRSCRCAERHCPPAVSSVTSTPGWIRSSFPPQREAAAPASPVFFRQNNAVKRSREYRCHGNVALRIGPKPGRPLTLPPKCRMPMSLRLQRVSATNPFHAGPTRPAVHRRARGFPGPGSYGIFVAYLSAPILITTTL